MPGPMQEPPMLSQEMADAVVRADPFSPQRRLVPPPATGGTGDREGSGDGGQPPQPAFTYKGRVHLGQRQRAIVEETTTRKTYFLEVGQEVAGFKVLDIAENQVVLSNLHTHEEVVVSLTTTALPAPREAQ